MSEIINYISNYMDHLPPGELAELRRASSTRIPAVFWKIGTKYPEITEPSRLEDWIFLISMLAIMKDFHNPNIPVGEGLAKSQYSEKRLTKLLSAKELNLKTEIKTAVRFLTSKAQQADFSNFSDLLTSKNTFVIRKYIAQKFYLNHKED